MSLGRTQGAVARLCWILGPGIRLATTSIGASHLVLCPRAGLLLWLQRP